jgi:hypothetical protein
MNLNLKKEMKINVYVATGAGLGLLAAGGLGGWLSARAYLSRSFYQRMDEEVDAIRLHYLNKSAKEASPEEVLHLATEGDPTAADLAGDFDERTEWLPDPDGEEAAQEPAGHGGASDADEAGPAAGEHAVAEVADLGESEEDERDHSRPYPISPSEFANTEPGWDAVSLTYYAGDKVLVDDKGEPVPNYVKIVGELTPAHFGGISGQRNLRIIRNDDRECDYEITMHETKYADEVLNYGRPL